MNEILSHAIKAIAYRFAKATTNASDAFGSFQLNDHTRSPNQIINHMFDLVCKTQVMIKEGNFKSPSPSELDFSGEVMRFKLGLTALQQVLSELELPMDLAKKLLQGPILDMTAHVGQLAMLRGISGNKVPKVSYFSADLDLE